MCHHTPTVTGRARDTNTTIATFHSINNNKSGVDLQSAHTSQIGYSHEHDIFWLYLPLRKLKLFGNNCSTLVQRTRSGKLVGLAAYRGMSLPSTANSDRN